MQPPRLSASAWKTRFGRRLLALFVTCTVVPGAILSAIAVQRVTRQLEAQTDRFLKSEAKRLAMGLLERLDVAADELLRWRADAGAAGASGDDMLGRFRGCGIVGPEGRARPLWGTGAPPRLPPQPVIPERPLLVTGTTPDEAPRLDLVLEARDGARFWCQLNPAALWRLDETLPAATELRVATTGGQVLLDTARAPGGERPAASSVVGEDAGSEQLRAAWTIPMAGNFQAENWVVTVSRQRAESQAAAREFRSIFLLVSLVSILAVLLVATIQIRHSLLPLRQLHDATRRLARGEFDVQLNVRSTDELGTMAVSFQAMAEQLREQFVTLVSSARLGETSAAGAGSRPLQMVLFEGLDQLGGWETGLLRRQGEPDVTWRRGTGPVPSLDLDPSSQPAVRCALELDGVADGELLLFGGASWPAERRELLAGLAQQYLAAEQRLALGRDLAAQRNRLQELLEQLPHGVFLLDAESRLELANGHARRYLEELEGSSVLPGGELTGGARSLLELPPGADWRELLLGGEPGRVFVAAVRELDTGSGAPSRLVMLRDVTEQKEVERRLQRQERLAAVGQLAAGMAHDLNNLLQGMGMCADALSGEALTAAGRRDLSLHAELHGRAATLISQVLDFCRRSPARPQLVHFVPAVREIVAFLRRTLPETILVGLHAPPETTDLRVRIDPTQLQQVIVNLALNSRDAMPEGGQLRLEVSVEATDETPPAGAAGWLTLSVRDEGCGISEELRERVFEPFFTTKEVGSGTGLGLAQVEGIVAQNDGRVELDSAPGVGTTVRIHLPFLAGDGERWPRAAADEAWRRGRGTVLVVEDEPVILKLVCRALEAMGYLVTPAPDGRAALDLLSSGPLPDLVLSDVVMPHFGGVQLLAEIRRRCPSTKVVLMSGYPKGAELDELQPDGWLSKPFTLAELADVLHGVSG